MWDLNTQARNNDQFTRDEAQRLDRALGIRTSNVRIQVDDFVLQLHGPINDHLHQVQFRLMLRNFLEDLRRQNIIGLDFGFTVVSKTLTGKPYTNDAWSSD